MRVVAVLFVALAGVGAMVHRPQLKGAKKADRNRAFLWSKKTSPKKHAPSDKNRRPPPYSVEPQYFEGRPEESVLLAEGAETFNKAAHLKAVLDEIAARPVVDNTNAEEDQWIMSSIKFPDPAQALANSKRIGPKASTDIWAKQVVRA